MFCCFALEYALRKAPGGGGGVKGGIELKREA
jgi:hypothetical protein